NNCIQVLVRDATPKSRATPVILPADALRPAGFGDEEAVLPYPRRSFIGYRVLQEYFCFPQKFFFFDLTGLDQVRAAGCGSRVASADPQSQEVHRFEPLYSFRHGRAGSKAQAFWHAARRPSGYRDDEGTEVHLSLVDLSGRPVEPGVEALTVRTICTNRDLPSRLPFGNEGGDFELEGALPL